MRHSAWLTLVCAATVLAGCHRPEESPASTTTPPAATPSTPAQAIDDRYQCDEMAVRVTHQGDGPVTLEFQATKLTLPRVISASGARFADEQGNEFWSKGGGAILNLTGQTMRNCVPASASSAESAAPSPY